MGRTESFTRREYCFTEKSLEIVLSVCIFVQKYHFPEGEQMFMTFSCSGVYQLIANTP